MKLKDRIRELLLKYPQLRDSDVELYCRILNDKYGVGLTRGQVQKMKGLSFESVSRARRKLREEEGIKGRETVENTRYELEQNYRQEYSKGMGIQRLLKAQESLRTPYKD